MDLNIMNVKTVDGLGMQPRDFCYWLQGFAELTPEAPSQEQWDLIREHLGLVFKKVTSEFSASSQSEIEKFNQSQIDEFVRNQTRSERVC